MGFPHSSVGKEFTCNAGDPGSIPGLGRSAGEGIGYPLQYSWASLVAQLIKNPPAMWETWVWSLGWERSLGEEKGFPLQYSGLENSRDCIAPGVTKSRTRLSNFHFQFVVICYSSHRKLMHKDAGLSLSSSRTRLGEASPLYPPGLVSSPSPLQLAFFFPLSPEAFQRGQTTRSAQLQASSLTTSASRGSLGQEPPLTISCGQRREGHTARKD